MSDLALQMNDYRLTTAEILYHLPDHPALLQSYIWQEYDLAPRYPELHKFLAFWEKNLEGPLHSVNVANIPIIAAPDTRIAACCLTLQ
ncbi:Usg family protein [Pelagibius litoralis]|uniref:Usg family protein n=1 Tax=Pelagibius litoralis TaxID=374515 RepID=A0A967F268_9PROT|nr:Usg family protein [Pelagibius litoralis]NIA71556.1 Usg family protein [Pelagibius litoralis]